MSFLLFKISKELKFPIRPLQFFRHLSLQEHSSHKLLNDNGIKTPRFGVAKSDKDAEKIARDLLTKNLMVKAQVLAGGRGLGTFKNGFRGGVHSATCPEEIRKLTAKMIGQKLVTKQTGRDGKICNSVMVTERKFPRREFYFAIALEREYNGPVVIASRQGGVNIEDVARHSPDAVIYEPIDICKGMTREMASWIARRIGICDQPEDTIKMIMNLYELFVKKDILLAEINPWVEDVCMNYYALDAKLVFDPSAKSRQWEIFGMADETQEDPKEIAAKRLEVSYIPLDGSIGCMVNGSGLAMATNDIIKFYGGSPANFLDTGSMANVDAVKNSIAVILMDKKVRTLFVNIYGGIMRCDIIVEGLLKAIKEFDIKIPIVARLQGNKYKEGREMVRKANMNIITCETFGEAAEMAVRCSKIMKLADEGDLEAILRMKTICDCEPAKPAFPNYPPRLPSQTSSTSGKTGVGDGKGGSVSHKASTPGDMKPKSWQPNKGNEKSKISSTTKLQPTREPTSKSSSASSRPMGTHIPPKKLPVASSLPQKPSTPPQKPYKPSITPQTYSVGKKMYLQNISESVAAKPPLKPPTSSPPRPMGSNVPPKKIIAVSSSFQKPSTPPQKSSISPPKILTQTSKPSSVSSSSTSSKPAPKPFPTATQSSPDKKPQTLPVSPTSNPSTTSPSKKSFSTVPSNNDKSQQDPKKPDNKDPFANGDTVIIKT